MVKITTFVKKNNLLFFVVGVIVFLVCSKCLWTTKENFNDRLYVVDYSPNDSYFPSNHCKTLNPKFKNAMGPECDLKLPGSLPHYANV